jgi:hypothetical protein
VSALLDLTNAQTLNAASKSGNGHVWSHLTQPVVLIGEISTGALP